MKWILSRNKLDICDLFTKIMISIIQRDGKNYQPLDCRVGWLMNIHSLNEKTEAFLFTQWIELCCALSNNNNPLVVLHYNAKMSLLRILQHVIIALVFFYFVEDEKKSQTSKNGLSESNSEPLWFDLKWICAIISLD